MPLLPGRSKAVIQFNIRKEIRAGKSPKQAYVIARKKAGLPTHQRKKGRKRK